ncbi:MAG: ATP-dependent sacrificial sulfur transferase LarE [Gemmatimonadales bacterium]|nr:ATP-dependent sacrificial sulfur transferase LarE [Gemmatimonadales bacterium]
MTDLDLLRRHLLGLGKVLLGYSGGVDSALLAVVATEALGDGRFLAVIGRSPSYPEVQWRAAVQLAGRFGVPLLELDTHELDDPRYLRNDTSRCYFCKSELWGRLGGLARERGYDTVIDGTNADDLGEHRPGLRAGRETSVRSPLAELGWSKEAVRAASRALGLPTWDAPAAPCLSSRVRYGLPITVERLRQVEEGEAFLRSLGVRGDLRVRHHGNGASIEVAENEMALLRSGWSTVGDVFARLGFDSVELDPQGYRRGRLLPLGTGTG